MVRAKPTTVYPPGHYWIRPRKPSKYNNFWSIARFDTDGLWMHRSRPLGTSQLEESFLVGPLIPEPYEIEDASVMYGDGSTPPMGVLQAECIIIRPERRKAKLDPSS